MPGNTPTRGRPTASFGVTIGRRVLRCERVREFIPTLCWLRGEQVGLVRAVASMARLRIVGVGTSEKGRAGALAAEFSDLSPGVVAAHDDLRAAMSVTDASLVLMAESGDFGNAAADAAAVEAAARRGARIVSFDPVPPSVQALALPAWGASVEARPLWGLVRSGASVTGGLAHGLEVLEQFGEVSAAALMCAAGREAGSLGARLVSAMDLVLRLMGEPEIVSASFAPPAEQRNARHETLVDSAGTLAATMRFVSGQSASVLVSTLGGPWHRGATILGPAGRLRVWDDGFVWTSPDGRVMDEHRAPDAAGDPAARAIAASIVAAMESAGEVMQTPGVLAMAETALLSARTGHGESPATLRRVADEP